jgi:hypothetical protein
MVFGLTYTVESCRKPYMAVVLSVDTVTLTKSHPCVRMWEQLMICLLTASILWRKEIFNPG